ncbi:TolC family protein [Ornithobacterium rhinotracheale]|uniref:TolC family protein n=1 Tax=Ornithobacterium rhinotracheale TaxID=28251 RepID=UPI00129CC3BB|nr:TolC family protein [Ornithobacterium rhinotracheale]MRJ07807.1 TolC family protein [Ornithobacterium rhinotracheale]UOH78676.1 TolC family protein [Ornithobacterium rhinotracheale]
MKKAFLFVFGGLFSLGFAQNQQWSLEQMVDYAKKHNLNLQQNKINTQLIDNRVTAANRQKLPTVSASIGNGLIAGVQGVPITNSNQQYVGKTNGFQLYQNSLSVSANMLLYNHGRLKLNEEKAKLDAQAAQEDLKALENQLTLQILNQYLNVLLQKELVLNFQQKLKLSENQLEQIQKLFNGGAIPLSNVYESKTQLARSKQNVATAEVNVQEALFNLAQLLQLKDTKSFDVLTLNLSENPQQLIDNIDQVIAYAYQNQPRIKNAEIKAQSSLKDIELAKTEFWPSLSASYGIGTNYRAYLNKGIDSDRLFDQWWNNHTHNFGLNLNIPIFNKNLTKLNVENAELQAQIAEKDIEIKKQQLKEEIQKAYFNTSSNYQKFIAVQEAVKSAEISMDFAQKSLEAGKITLYDFNQAAERLFSAKSELLQAKYNYIFSLKVLDFYLDKPITFN